MLRQFLNWRTVLAIVAILIVTGTIFYSRYLADKIAAEEKQKVEHWVQASYSLMRATDGDTQLEIKIIQDNDDVPIIWTNENDSIIDHKNLDSSRVARENGYVEKKLRQFKASNNVITYTDPVDTSKLNRYYFGRTRTLNEVQYYPIVQLIIVGLFIVITLFALRSSYRSAQNQVWVGLAKETAHQLGTPVSSLEGWVEMLKQNPANASIVAELEKDVGRLQLISDRFGKIGSSPQLETRDVRAQVQSMVDYMKKRASGKVNFSIQPGTGEIPAQISGPLFDWVIENLLKNSLDSMEGKGNIRIDIQKNAKGVYIDVTDSGKGISSKNIPKVFTPGFTTKKRGWGLGLSLSKRIVEQYHSGEIFVKKSEPGKGTTFRIVLKN